METAQDKLESLREILLTQDRADIQYILTKLTEIENLLQTQEKLAQRMAPIIADELEIFQENIPQKLGPTITETLKKQIEESKDEVVEALFPIIGKMIKRYIQNEFKILSEKINNQINHTFSFKRAKQKITAVFTGVKESDIILNDLAEATILQVFVIEKNSGLLLGSFTKENTIDKDLISGMLTAIKSFVEDAFQKEKQNLETIEYEFYNIHIQNFHTYYIATVISGILTEKEKGQIEDGVILVANKINKLKEVKNTETINEVLDSYFNK
jgi:hypothetical protein